VLRAYLVRFSTVPNAVPSTPTFGVLHLAIPFSTISEYRGTSAVCFNSLPLPSPTTQESAMISIVDLWLPILLSAVFVFIVSSIIHMMLRYHNNDFIKVPKEDEVMDALRKFEIPPGDYVVPRAGSMEAMKSPEFIEKAKKGPVLFMTVLQPGMPAMGGQLVLWFLYSVIIGIFAAYVAGRALTPDVHYLSVFRFVGATAFAGYSLALLQNSIWYNRNWSATLKSMFDGLIYALVTAGTFGWLWPS